MRFLLPVIGIVVPIVTGIALQTHFSSNQVAVAEATLGVPVYELHTNERDVKTLPEQEMLLP
jgi:hypothetical protein